MQCLNSKHPRKQILSEIVKPMLDGEPGIYRIKPEMWDQLDPYFLHFPLCKEFKNDISHRKKRNSIPVPIPSPLLAPSFEKSVIFACFSLSS